MPIRTLRLLCGEPADRVDDREPGADRPLGIILVRLGIAEIDEHAVAHILGDKTAKPADGVRDAAMVGADDLAQILGIEARGQRRRTNQVAEHHGQLAPLGLGGALDRGLRSPSRRCCGGQIIDRAQHALAMPEQYAEFLEVRLGQIGQGFEVDRIVAKDWRVLLQTQAMQPSADIQGLPPLSTTGFRCDTIAVR